MNFVPGEGSKDARLVLIGEAPGAREDALGRPFVGDSGMKLERWWTPLGLRRHHFYIDNVYPYRPPNNDITKISEADIEKWTDNLHERLAELTDPWLIVPVGNTALYALTGKSGITKWRGSILSYTDRRGRTIKVIPTIHPAALNPHRNPELERCVVRDWERIAGDSHSRELLLPEREVFVAPTLADLETFYQQVIAVKDTFLTIDIENVKGSADLLCIGFALDPGFAFVVPTTHAYWGSALDQAMQCIRELCALELPKGLQNGLFDSYQLATNGITINNFRWDTLAMHHCLDSTDDHSLAYMASVDTRQPYWKEMHRDRVAISSLGGRDRALWTYNGIDCCVTSELAIVYFNRLAEAGKLAFYETHYRRMIAPLLRMMRHGFRIDMALREELYKGLKERAAVCYDELAAIAGESLIAKKTFSKIKMEKFLYETLGLPKQTKTKKGVKKITADETALRKLMNNHKEKFGAAGSLILEARRAEKLSSFMAEKVVDPDGYIRCQYRFTTETGRLSSAANPSGTGYNLQNVDREARSIFLPDPGHILIVRDYSAIESRLVNIMTGDPELIQMALAKPWEFDEHKFYGSVIFGIPEEEVTKAQRYLGKRANHGSNYMMTGNKLSELLFNEGIIVSPKEAQGYIDKIMERFPAKRRWQEAIRQEVIENLRLETLGGRELLFTWANLNNEETFRQACAFKPQGGAAVVINQQGVIPMDAYFQRHPEVGSLIAQVHDSIIMSISPAYAWAVVEASSIEMEQPIILNGVTLSIPAGLSIGMSWGTEYEFKRPPSKEEVEAKVQELMDANV